MSWVNEQTGSYSLQPQDENKLVVINSSDAATVTVPEPGTWFGGTSELSISNLGSGVVTVSPISSTIDGEDSLTLNQYDGVELRCDGSNWFSIRGVSSGGGGSYSGNATEIQSVAVSSTSPTTGQVLEFNGSEYVPATLATGSTVAFGAADPNGANTPALVQSANAGQSTTVTTGSAVTIGNLLVVVAAARYTEATPTVADSLGTSFTQIASFVSTSGMVVLIWAGVATVHGVDTVTVSGASDPRMITSVMEVSACTVDIDGSVQTINSSGSPTSSLSVTTTLLNDFLICAYTDSGGNNGGSMSSPWTTLFFNGDGGYWDLGVGYQVASSATAYAGTWTLTDSRGNGAVMAALKATSAPVSGAEGDLYFKTSITPYEGFVYHDSVWNEFS